MAVKLIVPDAKSMLSRKCEEWRAKGGPTIGQPREPITSNTLSWQVEIEAWKILLNETERLLGIPALWQLGCDEPFLFEEISPVLFAFLNAFEKGSNGSSKAREAMLGKGHFWQGNDATIVFCCNGIFSVSGLCSKDEAKLLVRAKVRRLRGEIDYLKFRSKSSSSELAYERLPIPEEIRNEVWRRDQGKCVRCGSVRNLEFDHIIPLSRGGSGTARNVQLLCEECNRAKGAQVG
jgi:hypothetical protein